jgi:hypothetical protein
MVNQVHFNAYNAKTGGILNTSICGIENISYHFDIDSKVGAIAKYYYDLIGIDVFNTSDSFFNDVCFQFYDENKNDVILSQRREFIFQNVSLCEKGCDYNGINFDTSSLNCICSKQLPSLSEAKNLTETVGAGSWTKRLHEGNIECIKCYNLVFSSKYSKNNAGLITMVILLGLQIPATINLIFVSGFKHIYSFLNQFTYQTNNQHTNSNPPKRNKKPTITFNKVNFNSNNKMYNENEYEEDEQDSDNSETIRNESSINKNSNSISQSNVSDSSYSNRGDETKSNVKRTFYSTKNNYTEKKMFNNPLDSSQSESNSSNRTKPKNNKTIAGVKNKHHNSQKLTMLSTKPIHLGREKLIESKTNINTNSTQILRRKEYTEPDDAEVESFDEDEIDYLKLTDAVYYDKRSFLYFWWRVLKRKVIILRPFTDISVFEPFSIRITAFFFYLAWYFVLTCLFFRDKYIGARYLTHQHLGYSYTLHHAIIRSLGVGIICSVISIGFDYLLFVKGKFVLIIRYEKNQEKFLHKTKNLMKCYKIKLIFFFILNFILMIFFWYYVSSFCAVYVGTQYAMITAAIFALFFGIIYQAIFALIITILRHIGLKMNINICYKVSQVLL